MLARSKHKFNAIVFEYNNRIILICVVFIYNHHVQHTAINVSAISSTITLLNWYVPINCLSVKTETVKYISISNKHLLM